MGFPRYPPSMMRFNEKSHGAVDLLPFTILRLCIPCHHVRSLMLWLLYKLFLIAFGTWESPLTVFIAIELSFSQFRSKGGSDSRGWLSRSLRGTTRRPMAGLRQKCIRLSDAHALSCTMQVYPTPLGPLLSGLQRNNASGLSSGTLGASPLLSCRSCRRYR